MRLTYLTSLAILSLGLLNLGEAKIAQAQQAPIQSDQIAPPAVDSVSQTANDLGQSVEDALRNNRTSFAEKAGSRFADEFFTRVNELVGNADNLNSTAEVDGITTIAANTVDNVENIAANTVDNIRTSLEMTPLGNSVGNSNVPASPSNTPGANANAANNATPTDNPTATLNAAPPSTGTANNPVGTSNNPGTTETPVATPNNPGTTETPVATPNNPGTTETPVATPDNPETTETPVATSNNSPTTEAIANPNNAAALPQNNAVVNPNNCPSAEEESTIDAIPNLGCEASNAEPTVPQSPQGTSEEIPVKFIPLGKLAE
jgi:hypothetical protein